MPLASAAVRKTVTVLFCDLAGSTALGERVDPERLRELLAIWFDAMQEAVEQHGGTVEKFVGDAVMAVFGVPTVHEDDAVRAVRAALDMRDAVEQLNVELALPLEVRIGINTGEVATGDGAATLVSGDAVNTAKRLEQAAQPGEIVIGDATRRLVENAVDLEPLAPIEAKGKRRPVEAWRVRAAIPGALGVARRLDTPLVGRTAELELLREELAAATRDRTCRLVTVFGPAGIGKSRLAAELRATLTARCLPYGDGISLQPLADLVHAAGGERAVLDAVAAEEDGALVAARICEGGGTTEEHQWAVRRLLETFARRHPLVVCIEDVHWAQPAFLDLLEYIAGWTRDAPILLVCLARPELLDVRPRWPGRSLTLGPLSGAETDRLLDELAAEWPLDAAARAQIAETAEGNPLFVEQLVAMLADGRGPAELPPTIQALLAARLDALEPDERRVLERASVVGRDFSRAAVAALADGDVSACLLALVRKELLRPLPSPYADADGFQFRHALIRDAAYSAVPKRVRADLHERAADWLTEHDGDDEIVGFHLEQAHLLRRDLGLHDPWTGERAGGLLGAAGRRAAARADAASASQLLQRALALLPADDPRRAAFLRDLSESLWARGEREASERALDESIALAQAAGDVQLEWYGRVEHAARVALVERDPGALAPVAERAIAIFDELGDDLGLARAWRRLGLVAFVDKRHAEAAAHAERALAHAVASGDESERARSADLLCSSLVFGPARVPEAVARLETLFADAGHNVVLRANVGASLAALLAMNEDIERARALIAEARATYDELGLELPRIGCDETASTVELLAGEPHVAVHLLRKSLSALDGGGYGRLRDAYVALLALLLGMTGDLDGARALLDGNPPGPSSHETARLLAARALVDNDAALAREAVALADATDELNLRAELHVVLARVLGDDGELETARRLYELKGNVAATVATASWSLQH